MIGGGGIDAALLDINLDGKMSYPVADELASRGIPFVFSTGYGGEDLPDGYEGVPLLKKPFRRSGLGDALAGWGRNPIECLSVAERGGHTIRQTCTTLMRRRGGAETSAVQRDVCGDVDGLGRGPRLERSAEPGLSILLLESDIEVVAAVSTLLRSIFGDCSSCDWVSDAAQGVELMRQGNYDIVLFAATPKTGDAAQFVCSSMSSGCGGRIIVLADNDNTDLDLRAMEAGAADCIPKDELTPGILERSIRHALLREFSIARARRKIARLSEELARLNALRDANRRFVDEACHDFRSPLMAIQEYSLLIAEGLAGDVNKEQSEFLEIILMRVGQLGHMVDAILDASRLESDLVSVKREEQAPAKLIEQARPTLEQLVKSRNSEIRFSVADSLPNVFADADSVGRIIVNLVTNAYKFAGEHGEIEIWARLSSDEGSVTIGVTDHGPGIASGRVKLIFERFKPVEDGSGLSKAGFGPGLHVASELARVNFGTLSVESEPEKGSTAAFTLPIFDADLLVPLHFDFLKTSRHGFQYVLIAVATVGERADPDTFVQVERFLNRQVRSYDLLLRLHDNSWLVCIACDEDDLAGTTGRIECARTEHNRNHPDHALPVTLPPEGTRS